MLPKAQFTVVPDYSQTRRTSEVGARDPGNNGQGPSLRKQNQDLIKNIYTRISYPRIRVSQ